VDFLPKFGIPAYPIGCYIAPYFIAITMIALTKHDFLVSISLLTRKILIVSGFLTLALAAFTTIYFLMKPREIEMWQRYFLRGRTRPRAIGVPRR
jgi:hypothetical protein